MSPWHYCMWQFNSKQHRDLLLLTNGKGRLWIRLKVLKKYLTAIVLNDIVSAIMTHDIGGFTNCCIVIVIFIIRHIKISIVYLFCVTICNKQRFILFVETICRLGNRNTIIRIVFWSIFGHHIAWWVILIFDHDHDTVTRSFRSIY